MTDPAVVFAFSLTAGAIVVSPGPDTTPIIRHTLATVLGLSLVIAASKTAPGSMIEGARTASDRLF